MIAAFIGRFQPFHLGHLGVIKWILERYERVVVIIGSSQESHTVRNPFTFSERRQMIESSLKNEGIEEERYTIIGIPDVYNDELWVESIQKAAKFDVVFTLDPWTERCFKEFNIPVKKQPVFGDTSATKVRETISRGGDWENLIPKGTSETLQLIGGVERVKNPRL